VNARQGVRRWLPAAAWVLGGLAVFGLLLRISLTGRIDSDGANNALQAWDLLHGHLLLHGWDIGDANFYFFELPLNALTAAVFGLGNFAMHVASALTYLLVALCAVALAVTDSRGPARVVRAAVVVTVMAAPLLALQSVKTLLEEPDHTGTSVFILVAFLLVDQAARPRAGLPRDSAAGGDGGRGAPHSGESSPPEPAGLRLRTAISAPLLCVILCAGEFSDLTVRYVAVPAIVLVCGCRALAARRLRSPDAAFVAAAIVSVPLVAALSAVFTHLGGFIADAPRAQLAPTRLWPHQAIVTWGNLRLLYGGVSAPGTRLGGLGTAFGMVCLLVSLAGLAWVAWRWRRASRAELMLGIAIVVNFGLNLVSTLVHVDNPHEIAAVLPCGAVLAARLVPGRIANSMAAFAALTVAGLLAVIPLACAAVAPLDQPKTAPLTAWLRAHGLTYGLAGYWDSSAATLLSGDKVQIRTFNLSKPVSRSHYEVNNAWYDPAQHDATFIVADPGPGRNYPVAPIERAFGKPAGTYPVANFIVLVYHENLLPVLLRGGVNPGR
jgi:hypothetical protein